MRSSSLDVDGGSVVEIWDWDWVGIWVGIWGDILLVVVRDVVFVW